MAEMRDERQQQEFQADSRFRVCDADHGPPKDERQIQLIEKEIGSEVNVDCKWIPENFRQIIDLGHQVVVVDKEVATQDKQSIKEAAADVQIAIKRRRKGEKEEIRTTEETKDHEGQEETNSTSRVRGMHHPSDIEDKVEEEVQTMETAADQVQIENDSKSRDNNMNGPRDVEDEEKVQTMEETGNQEEREEIKTDLKFGVNEINFLRGAEAEEVEKEVQKMKNSGNQEEIETESRSRFNKMNGPRDEEDKEAQTMEETGNQEEREETKTDSRSRIDEINRQKDAENEEVEEEVQTMKNTENQEENETESRSRVNEINRPRDVKDEKVEKEIQTEENTVDQEAQEAIEIYSRFTINEINCQRVLEVEEGEKEVQIIEKTGDQQEIETDSRFWVNEIDGPRDVKGEELGEGVQTMENTGEQKEIETESRFWVNEIDVLRDVEGEELGEGVQTMENTGEQKEIAPSSRVNKMNGLGDVNDMEEVPIMEETRNQEGREEIEIDSRSRVNKMDDLRDLEDDDVKEKVQRMERIRILGEKEVDFGMEGMRNAKNEQETAFNDDVDSIFEELFKEKLHLIIDPHHLFVGKKSPMEIVISYIEAYSSFFRDVEIQLKVQHENLVMFIGASKLNRTVVIDGSFSGSLLNLLQKMQPHPLVFCSAIQYAIDICQAMRALHSNNITHNNLWVGNVFLTDDLQHVKVANFGDDVFCPWAPKVYNVCQGEKNVGIRHKVDVFAFSFLLRDMITNNLISSEEELIREVVHCQARPSLEGVPLCLHQLLIECWDENASNRPEFEAIETSLREIQKDLL